VPDPFGGSYYVEALTDEMERAARALLDQVESLGGSARAIERGYFQEAIARSAYEYQGEVERGEAVVVGVNRFGDGSVAPPVASPDYAELAAAQRRRLAETRASRDGNAIRSALDALRAAAAAPEAPLMPLIVDAVRARATVGEISDTLRGVWGVYQPG
jgi:methylmalonyl-CoA mutase N-terminal domain/subunit